jgi:hypothetical protein
MKKPAQKYPVEIRSLDSKSKAYSMIVLNSYKNMILCDVNGSILSFDLNKKKSKLCFDCFDQKCVSLCEYQHFKFIAGPEDGRLCLFNRQNEKCLKVFYTHPAPIVGLAFRFDKNSRSDTLYSGCKLKIKTVKCLKVSKATINKWLRKLT